MTNDEKVVEAPPFDLKERTFQYARRVIRVCRSLPSDPAAWAIGKQLIRSGTSVGANYREADRGRSSKEFTSNLGICIRELAETEYWLELVSAEDLLPSERLEPLLDETHQLIAIFTSIRRKTLQKPPNT